MQEMKFSARVYLSLCQVSFYAPALKDQGHIVVLLSLYWSVSVCKPNISLLLQNCLTYNPQFWYEGNFYGGNVFHKHILLLDSIMPRTFVWAVSGFDLFISMYPGQHQFHKLTLSQMTNFRVF